MSAKQRLLSPQRRLLLLRPLLLAQQRQRGEERPVQREHLAWHNFLPVDRRSPPQAEQPAAQPCVRSPACWAPSSWWRIRQVLDHDG